MRTFLRITVPLMLGGIVGGMVLTWVTVASELSSTVVLYSGPWPTMTVIMFQALEGTGAGEATAAATILIVFTVVPVALVYRLLRRYELSLLSDYCAAARGSIGVMLLKPSISSSSLGGGEDARLAARRRRRSAARPAGLPR